MTEGLLAPYRVLDLTGEEGNFAGRVLADLGADVILIEPPGGSSGRRRGPFYRDDPHPEHSLFFWANNVNKRAVTLDLSVSRGRELFAELVRQADFVLESFPPGYLDSLGLGYDALSRLNSRIILTSISAFGQTGPRKDYQATDLVGMAMGGMMSVTGDAGQPPVRISAPQAWLQACGEAVAGSMLAHYYRELSGEGQHVDVSMQQSVAWLWVDKTACARPDFYGVDAPRTGAKRDRGGVALRQIFPCKDGYVSLYYVGGRTESISTRNLLRLMDEAGMAPQWLKAKDWDNWGMAALAQCPDGGQSEVDAVEGAIIEFLTTKTPAELFDLALEHSILLSPVSTVELVTRDRQLAVRDFWREVEHPELGLTVTYPGPFIQGSAHPARFYRRPPRLSEHNKEVYEGMLGLAREEVHTLADAGVI